MADTKPPQSRSLSISIMEKGYRLTSQRRVLVETIERAEHHLDAATLLALAAQRDSRINRATVYRTLSLLKKLQLVDELDLMHLEGEKHFYEIRPEHDHMHLACCGCGKITEFSSVTFEQLKHEIAEHTGFEIEVARLEVGGRCSHCSGDTKFSRPPRRGKKAKR